MRTVRIAELRSLVVAAQGYSTRVRTGTVADVEAVIRRLACVQLDSISTVERSHRIAIASRAGHYPRGTISTLLAQGRVFEYWAHEASLLPAAAWPLFAAGRREGGRHWYGDVDRSHPHLREQILAEIRAGGARTSRQFEGAARGGMWDWKPAKAMLELLWNHGELVVAGRRGFQRLYDLPERVLPRELLEAPAPPEPERLRRLALLAVHARGALTEAGVVEHWRLRGGVARIRPALDGLVADGLLERARVDDGGPDVLLHPGSDAELGRPAGAVLLSPFDNLLWDRRFARRVLGFDHLIEVYKPAPQRRYGYYVLPLLWRDRIVGRADVRSDRTAGDLVVRAFHREPGVRPSRALGGALERALERLRRACGLDRVRR